MTHCCQQFGLEQLHVLQGLARRSELGFLQAFGQQEMDDDRTGSIGDERQQRAAAFHRRGAGAICQHIPSQHQQCLQGLAGLGW